MSKTVADLDFQLTGQIRQLIPDRHGDAWKALDLQVDSGLTYRIKIAKEIDDQALGSLEVGLWVGVAGYGKPSKSGGMPKLKALNIFPGNRLPEESAGSLGDRPTARHCQILICTKSGCRKRGAHQIKQQLETWSQEQGLSDRVATQETGCLKACKHGPTLRLMPLGQQFTGVTPELLAVLSRQLG